MNFRHLFIPALILAASPAHAERLQFDHRLYPPLKEALDSGDAAKVDFNNKNPARLVDLIVIKGKSTREWSEALEIISITRPADVATARDWMAVIERQAQTHCPATFALLAEDANSVTFERRSPHCPAERASLGIYRLVAGKRSWFQLAVLATGELDALSRQQWLALLQSAHLD